MKKFFLMVLMLLFSFSIAFAQGKKEKRVYYLDCSWSMKNPNKLWKPVTENLKNAISSISDTTTEIWVIPFAYNDSKNLSESLKGCNEYATDEGKRTLLSYIDNLDTKLSKKSKTYHIVPIKDFENFRIDPSKENYMFIMTDGEDELNNGITFNNEVSSSWGKFSKNKDVYGFYVMLNESCNDKKRKGVIDKTEKFWHVNTANVNINTIKLSESIEYKIRTDSYIDINCERGSIKSLDLICSLDDKEEPPFKIEKSVVKEEANTIRLYLKRDGKKDLHKMVENSSYSLKIEKKNNSESDLNILLTPKIKIKCLNVKENHLEITCNDFETEDAITRKSFGTIEYYDSYLWMPDSVTPVARKIQFAFNEDALGSGDPYAIFKIVDEKGIAYGEDVLTVYDGKNRINSSFIKVDKNTKELLLTFNRPINGENKSLLCNLRLVDHNIQSINKINLENAKSSDVLKWKVDCIKHNNPLLNIIYLLGLILLLLLLTLIVIYRIHVYNAPKFPVDRRIEFQSNQNIVLQPNGKSLHSKKQMEIIAPDSSTIYTDLLHNTFVKEIILMKNCKSHYEYSRWHGYTFYVNCNFGVHDNIKEIIISPKKNKIIGCIIKKEQNGKNEENTLLLPCNGNESQVEINRIDDNTLYLKTFKPVMN